MKQRKQEFIVQRIVKNEELINSLNKEAELNY